MLVALCIKEIDVSVVDRPTEREKALNIALNRTSGDWEKERLAKLLNEPTFMPEFDFTLTG